MLVWVAIVLIGVVSSIASSRKKQPPAPRAQPGQSGPSAPQPLALGARAQFVSAQRIAPATVPAPPPDRRQVAATVRRVAKAREQVEAARMAPEIVRLAEHENLAPRRWQRLFDSRSSLVRAVVASEVLGKPRALRDE